MNRRARAQLSRSVKALNARSRPLTTDPTEGTHRSSDAHGSLEWWWDPDRGIGGWRAPCDLPTVGWVVAPHTTAGGYWAPGRAPVLAAPPTPIAALQYVDADVEPQLEDEMPTLDECDDDALEPELIDLETTEERHARLHAQAVTREQAARERIAERLPPVPLPDRIGGLMRRWWAVAAGLTLATLGWGSGVYRVATNVFGW